MSHNILIVEDHKESGMLLSRLLNNNNFNSLVHDNGCDVVMISRRENAELIILDLDLPCKPGFEVLADLRNDESTKEIPVIILSASSQIDKKIKGFELGSLDYIVKPIHPEELIARIHSALRRSVIHNN